MLRPVIGITVDNLDNTAASGRYDVGIGYSDAVAAAGGMPVLLPHVIERVGDYLSLCDGFILTGGVDPDTTAFGESMHPKAKRMDPTRQAFESALIEAIRSATPRVPTLGVCLGMQLMALHAGGRLDQHLPDTLGDAAAVHHGNRPHPIVIMAEGNVFESDALNPTSDTVSHHLQAVTDAGAMRVIATAPDGVIEAIDDPDQAFYVGVQWHPERGDDSSLNRGLFAALVRAAS